MATISENLQIINDSIAAIKQSIIDKGGNVSGDITTWADAISKISGSGGGDSIEYLDVSGLDEVTYEDVVALSILGKIGTYILPTGFAKGMGGDNERFIAIAVDLSQECYVGEIGTNTLQLSQIIDILGTTDVFSSIPRLTKEQFYSFE